MAKKNQRESLSKEATIAKMAAIRADINTKVIARNATNNATELAKLEKEIGDGIKEYNSYAHDLVLLNHLGSPNAVRELCEMRKFDTIAKKTKAEESGFRTMTIEDSKSNIDLTKINDVKVTAPWLYRAQMFAMWITGETAGQLEIENYIDEATFMRDLTKFFKISDEAKAYAKESGTPSSRSTLEVLRGVVGAMIGTEYGEKVISAHVRFIKCGLTTVRKNDQTGTVRFAKIDEIIGLIADVCNLILTNHKVKLDIAKSLTKAGKEWQDSNFKPTEVIEVPAESPAPAPAESPAPVEKPKSKAKSKSKAK